jgi:hypothetical protein
MPSPGIVISNSDLQRIKTMVGSGKGSTGILGGTDATLARSKAEDLHHKSQMRAKSWSNTLEGSRRKKAEEKRKKLEAEELERQRIDAQEAKLQLDARKGTIDRANKLMYDESDRMKSFHSRMMLCDVLAEREAQISLKTELKKLEHVREDRFLEMEKQNYRKMLERELKEKGTQEELSRLTAKAQKEQLAEYMEKRYREVEDDMLEGELLRRKAGEDMEAEKAAEKKRRAQAVKAVQDTARANEYLKQIKAEDALREEREEQKIQEHAERKEKMIALRRQKEEEVFNAKQAARNKIIEEQATRLAAIVDTEDKRVEAQVQAAADLNEQRRLQKEALHRRWNDDINNSRAAQIERKQKLRDKEREEDAETARFLGEWCKVLDKQEHEEAQAKRETAVKLAAEHKKQVEIARRKVQEEKRQTEGISGVAKRALEADTLEFHDYAEKAIRAYSEEGKNVIPLIKELREFRKRVLD